MYITINTWGFEKNSRSQIGKSQKFESTVTLFFITTLQT